MKSFFILTALLFALFLCYGQPGRSFEKRDSIIYVFPEMVEKLLFKELMDGRSHNQGGSEFIYIRINHRGKDTVDVGLNYQRINQELDSSSCCYYYVYNTNRFAIIGSDFIPVMFWDDFVWSTTKPDELGTLGTREQIVRKCFCPNDFIYSVIFTSREVIEASNSFERNAQHTEP